MGAMLLLLPQVWSSEEQHVDAVPLLQSASVRLRHASRAGKHFVSVRLRNAFLTGTYIYLLQYVSYL